MLGLAIWPLVFAIVGILMYVLCANPKLQEIGKIIFFCGFFFVTMVLSSQVLHLPPR